MPTRTLTLSDTVNNLDNTPSVGLPIQVYLLVPGGGAAVNLEGDAILNGTAYGADTVTNGSGHWSVTAVYPGDLTPAGCQLAVLEGTTLTLSPVGFSYAASITVSSWYATSSTAGTLPMLLDVNTVGNAASQGTVVRFGITATAVDPNGNAINANATVALTTDSTGKATINLFPSTTLNPTTTSYILTFPDGTTWYFLTPVHPTGYQGAWSGGTTYHVHAGTKASPSDVVSLAGVYYQAVADSTNHTPPNATYWQVWPGEPVTWDLTSIVSAGGVVITPAGIGHSANVPAIANDPVSNPVTLNDDLANLVYRIAHLIGLGAWATKTTSYALLSTDTDILMDATGGALTATLPTAVGQATPFTIKKKDVSVHAVTVATTGGQTIDGASSQALNAQWATITVASDGANYFIVSSTTL